MIRSIKKTMLVAALFALGFPANVFAEEITLVLSGQTHAMLYPCDCPIEPDGGIARRATLIQQIRKSKPNILLLDSGNFFAGGVMDVNSQDEELNKSRTLVNLKAMNLMQYDAALLSPDEFKFGRQFLQNSIVGSKISFLAADIVDKNMVPFLIKKFGDTTVGVIGLVRPFSWAKVEGMKVVAPAEALKKSLEELKKENVDLFILLSGLDEDQNQALLKDNPEIGIIIHGGMPAKDKAATNIGPVFSLSPRAEGRRLVVASLSIKNKKLTVKNVEELRVWDKLAGDKQVLAILPQCYSQKNCKKEGMIADCANPGKPEAVCQYKVAPKTMLTVINKADCWTCNADIVVNSLKNEFPGLMVDYLNFSGEKAQQLISKLGIRYLPFYLLDKSIDQDPAFEKIKQKLEPKDEYYLLKGEFSGIGFFLNRPKLAGRLDVFLNIFDKDSAQILDTLKEFAPEVHFLVREERGAFFSAGGRMEVEESLRAVCVQKYYPGFSYNYLRCRANNIDSSWWEDCLPEELDLAQVRSCARSSEGQDLLRKSAGINRELDINSGPSYLMDNQEIFSSIKVPQKEEFRKILKR